MKQLERRFLSQDLSRTRYRSADVPESSRVAIRSKQSDGVVAFFRVRQTALAWQG